MLKAYSLQSFLLTLCIGLCAILAIATIVLMGAEYEKGLDNRLQPSGL